MVVKPTNQFSSFENQSTFKSFYENDKDVVRTLTLQSRWLNGPERRNPPTPFGQSNGVDRKT